MFGRKQKSECGKVREILSTYLDDRLESVERDMVTYHVERCSECQAELESLSITIDLLRQMPMVSAPRSFQLSPAYARRNWFSFNLPSLPAFGDLQVMSGAGWMRMATAAAVIAFALLISLDLSGALTQEASDTGITAGDVTENPPVPDPAGVLTPSPDEPVLPGTEEWDALPPEEGSDITIGSDVSPKQDPSDQTNVPKPPEAVDPYGESGVSSPTPRSSTPSWLLPLQIATGALTAIFGGISLMMWRRRSTMR